MRKFIKQPSSIDEPAPGITPGAGDCYWSRNLLGGPGVLTGAAGGSLDAYPIV